MRYRSKPVEVYALQVGAGSEMAFPGMMSLEDFASYQTAISPARPGDWLVRLPSGSFALMADDDFRREYDPAPIPEADRTVLANWLDSHGFSVPVRLGDTLQTLGRSKGQPMSAWIDIETLETEADAKEAVRKVVHQGAARAQCWDSAHYRIIRADPDKVVLS